MGLGSRLRSDAIQARAALTMLGLAIRYRSSSRWCPAMMLEQNASRIPHRVALRFLDESLTWRQLDGAANRWARVLADRGVARGDVVALLMDNRAEYVEVLLATSKLGAVCACVNTNATGKTLAHAVGVVRPRLVVVGSEHFDALSAVVGDVAPPPGLVVHADRDVSPTSDHVNAELASQDPTRPPGELPMADEDQAFLYTSGTTGLPKAARITNRRFCLAAGGFAHVFHEATESDVIYSALPLYHGTAQWGAFGASLASGAALALRRKFSASGFWDDVRRYEATHVMYIGEVCRYLVNQPPRPDDREHRVRVATGNGLRKDVWPVFQERFGIETIREFYGATEGNAPMVNLEGRPGMIGRLNLGQVLIECDLETGAPRRNARGYMTKLTERGQTGLLLGKINAIAKFDGYLDDDATEKKILRDVFRKGDTYFNSGDLLTNGDDGWVSFADRIGDTFRWKSENVSTNEVAEILNGARGVLESNVYGVEVPGAEGRAGMASLNVSDEFELGDFARHVLSGLASYQRPYFLRVQREMRTTGTFKHQKVDYRAEGYDPGRVSDPLYFLEGERYVPIDAALYARLRSGEVAPR